MSTPTPDEKLTTIIIEKLRQQNLTPENKVAELQTTIANGTIRAEDWRSFIELALPREEKPLPEGQDE